MSIRVKSEELRRFFRNNGVVTEEAVQSIFNKINIELVTTSDGQVSQDLLDDLVLINATYPQLLRHTTIINNTGSAVDMQPILDVLATYPNKSFDTLKSLTIKSKYDSDFDLDYSKLSKIDRLVLSGGNRVSKVTFSPDKLKIKHDPEKDLELELENFDLSNLDLTDTSINSLKLTGRGTRNFTRAKGLSLLRTLKIKDKDLDREFYDIVDFINDKNSKVSTIEIDGVNLSVERLFELFTSEKITELMLRNSKLTNLEGLDKWNGRLTVLDLFGNDLKEKDISTLMKFMKENPQTEVDFSGNSGITKFFNSLSTSEFSEHTRRNIFNTLLTTDGPREVKNKDVIQLLANDPSIPISLTDAEVIRGQAGVTLNPIEIPNGVNFETVDFDKSYLKGGTLLVSPAQLEELKRFGKLPKDMTLAVRIRSANELSAEEVKKMYFEDGIAQVVMMNEDGTESTRTPMTATEYYHIRNILDEVVEGIDSKESDIQKFVTVYSRLSETVKYDQTLTSRMTPKEIRYAGKEKNNARNLRNGLLDGNCVCAGYAEILRNALSLVGIKSKMVVGKCFNDPDYTDRHAWNAVELTDEKGNKKWYYTDLTWDAGNVINGKAKNMLLGKDEFIKHGHQVVESYDVPEISNNEFNRGSIEAALRYSKKIMLNPREAYRDTKKSGKKEQKTEEPIKDEEPEEVEEQDEERVQSEEELADIAKRASCRSQMDDIYRILDTTTRLDPASRKNYYSKLEMLEEKMKELDKKIEGYGKKSSKKETKPKTKQEPQKKDPIIDNDKKQMPDIVMDFSETKTEGKKDKEFEELVENGGVRRLLPTVRTREELIVFKKQNMLEKAEKGFVGFTNKLFGRNDNKPPRFISGIIKFALNTRFWVQDRIRDLRDKDDKIDDELMSIAMVEAETKRKREEARLVEKHEISVPRNPNKKKTIAEREAEKAKRKKELQERFR